MESVRTCPAQGKTLDNAGSEHVTCRVQSRRSELPHDAVVQESLETPNLHHKIVPTPTCLHFTVCRLRSYTITPTARYLLMSTSSPSSWRCLC